MGYEIKLTGKNEILEYVEGKNEYGFDVYLSKKTWTVNLPGFKNGEKADLSEDEKKKILPRINAYLKNIRWFGVFGGNYKVNYEKTEPIDFEEYLAQEELEGNEVVRSDDGSVTVIPLKRKSILQRLFS